MKPTNTIVSDLRNGIEDDTFFDDVNKSLEECPDKEHGNIICNVREVIMDYLVHGIDVEEVEKIGFEKVQWLLREKYAEIMIFILSK